MSNTVPLMFKRNMILFVGLPLLLMFPIFDCKQKVEANGKVYVISDARVNFESSETVCDNFHGTVAKIKNNEEFSTLRHAVKDVIGDKTVWLNTISSSGSWNTQVNASNFTSAEYKWVSEAIASEFWWRNEPKLFVFSCTGMPMNTDGCKAVAMTTRHLNWPESIPQLFDSCCNSTYSVLCDVSVPATTESIQLSTTPSLDVITTTEQITSASSCLTRPCTTTTSAEASDEWTSTSTATTPHEQTSTSTTSATPSTTTEPIEETSTSTTSTTTSSTITDVTTSTTHPSTDTRSSSTSSTSTSTPFTSTTTVFITTAPTTIAPTTAAPTTTAPTTTASTTTASTTTAPTTTASTTTAPTTTTVFITTAPTTTAPTTAAPTTTAPSTTASTTTAPKTAAPTTTAPATAAPSTTAPTTAASTTTVPATAAPTTTVPATAAPTTTAPTTTISTTTVSTNHARTRIETEEQLSAMLKELRVNLTVNTSELSSYTRRRNSATDERVSSSVFGSGAILIFVTLLGAIIMVDVGGHWRIRPEK